MEFHKAIHCQTLKLVAFFLLGLLCPLTASAGEVVLSEVGSGQWQVSATGLTNVHALDLDLRYDPQRLSGLTATAGLGLSGAMTAINDKVPGVIRLGAASTQPLAQSGLLLKLQTSTPGAEMVVSRFTVKTVDGDGKVVVTAVRQQLPAPSFLTETIAPPLPETVVTPSAAIPTVTSSHTGGSSGSVTFPAKESSPSSSPQGEEELLPPSMPTGVPSANISLSAVPASSGPDKRFHSQEEIVTAIFRLPQPWTVAAIKTIFLSPATTSQVRQEPPVVLADGKSRVKLYLPKALSQKTPSVGVRGCTLGTITDAGDQGWQVELVTRKDIWPATALLLGEGDLIQFPVVIVPVLTSPLPISDKGTLPAVDFDGDGAITALDAYLYVGNLLAH